MSNKTNNFESAGRKIRKDIEVENAKQQLELLHRYNESKTDDERRAITNTLDKDLLNIFTENLETPTSIIPKLEMAISKDKFRPRNQSLFRFALNPDLEYVNGDFSTAIPGRKVTAKTDKNALRKSLKNTLSNLDNVAAQYATDIIGILDAAPDWQIISAIDADLEIFQELLSDIAQNLISLYKIKVPLNIFIELDTTTTMMSACCPVRGFRDDEPFGYEITIYFSNIKKFVSKNLHKTNLSYNKFLFAETIAAFCHEFGHFVDMTAPNRGALGAQTCHICKKIYDLSKGKYKDNPTEASSFKIQEKVFDNIVQWLQPNNNRD